MISFKKKKNSKQEKTWIVLLLISQILFLILGVVMIVFDTKYITGIEHLLTFVIFFYATYLIRKKKIDLTDPSSFNYFGLGFIFSVVGLNTNPAVWGLGVVFFAISVLKNRLK